MLKRTCSCGLPPFLEVLLKFKNNPLNADFKSLTRIFSASFPSFRPYSMFGMLSHSRASLTFSVSHPAECDSACAVVQSCLDDDRPPYHRGHASVQEGVLRLGHLGQQSPPAVLIPAVLTVTKVIYNVYILHSIIGVLWEQQSPPAVLMARHHRHSHLTVRV